MTYPLSNLVRLNGNSAAHLRSADGDETGDGNHLVGYFAVFEQWTEINSVREGRFMERIVPGAFVDTFQRNRERIKVLYDHGQDPSIGNKPLGRPISMTEDGRGAVFDVELFDTPYVDQLKPAIAAGQMGTSFRFSIRSKDHEQWVRPKRPSVFNPEGLDERTILIADVYEFGPVTFPAYEGASVGLRSMTDRYFDHLLDPVALAEYINRVGSRAAAHVLTSDVARGADLAKESDPQVARGAEESGNGRSILTARSFLISNRRKRD